MCLIALIAWLSPRFAIFVMWVFTDRLRLAFDSFLIGALGFALVPYATVLYALAHQPGVGVRGFGWVLVVVGLMLDMGSWGAGDRSRRRRSR